MLTIYGRTTSVNVQVVMWAVAELDLEYRRLDYGEIYGGVDTSEFRAMNPNGKVPVLTDGDLVMFESQAILRYLAARYGDASFWPETPAARAALDVWAEWTKTTFFPGIMTLFRPLVRDDPAQLDQAALDAGAARLRPLAEMLEARIGAGPWLAGDSFTWADLAVGHVLPRYFGLPFDRADTPSLRAYFARLKDRPAFATHAMVSWEPLRFKGGA